jgi:flavin reductase (DIM6/NTAB) family NADH-FMN oxidoreductase RutF
VDTITACSPLPHRDECRRIFGAFPTGVTVVTAGGAHGPVGMAVNSFTSLSLDPLLVLVCVGRSSSTWPEIEKSGRFCVNVLAADQRELARRFAAKGEDRFRGVALTASVGGSPMLEGSVAYVDCAISQTYDGGDHVIVVGAVLGLGLLRPAAPLLFVGGRFGIADGSPTAPSTPDGPSVNT